MSTEDTFELIKKIIDLCIEGLQTDGGHHKQWYLEEILRTAGMDTGMWRDTIGWEEGFAG